MRLAIFSFQIGKESNDFNCINV